MIIIKSVTFLYLQSLLLADFLNKWISGQSEPGSALWARCVINYYLNHITPFEKNNW